jgi:hypothetical protein
VAQGLDLGPIEARPLKAFQIHSTPFVYGDAFYSQELDLLCSRIQADLTTGIDHAMPRYVAALGKPVERPADGAGGPAMADDGRDLPIGGDLAPWDQTHDLIDALEKARDVVARPAWAVDV